MIGAAPSNRAVLPADVRALIVRQIGAALAQAWRRQHESQPEIEIEKGAREPSQPASGPSRAAGEVGASPAVIPKKGEGAVVDVGASATAV